MQFFEERVGFCTDLTGLANILQADKSSLKVLAMRILESSDGLTLSSKQQKPAFVAAIKRQYLEL